MPKQKNDPRHIAAARELHDRWLEQVNAGTIQLEGAGKYDVGRRLEAAPIPSVQLMPMPLLKAA
jgi:hypothetical protein